MQKLIDYIKAKSLTDPSMVNIYDLLLQNPGNTEDVLLLAFTAIYESNRKLGESLVKAIQAANKGTPNKIVHTETYKIDSSDFE